MPQEKSRPGTAKVKRNSWSRGRGSYSYRGELRHGIRLNKRRLNRSVRHNGGIALNHGDYKKITRTNIMVSFS